MRRELIKRAVADIEAGAVADTEAGNVKDKEDFMKRKLVRVRGKVLRVVVSLQVLLTPVQMIARAGSLVAQTRPGVTAEEARRARAAAVEFTDRLLRARDLAPVVREMFVADFARRYIQSQAKRTGNTARGEFMFEGVPALQFKTALTAHAESELWPRLYVAANTLLHYGFLTFMAKGGTSAESLEKDLLEVYPPAVRKLFAERPALANFFVKRGDYKAVATLEELRETVETMEQAVRLSREQLDRRLPLKLDRLDANMSALRSVADSMEVQLLPTGDAELMGYTADTRLLRILSPIGLVLILAPEGDRLKVVWASTVRD